MKISSLQFRALSVAILCSIAPVTQAQTTATTVPAGFITITIPAAANGSTPSNRALSIPLYKTADFVGVVASVDSANQVTLTGAVWTANQFASVTAPRLLRIKTGANTGKFFLVTANTPNQVTVDLTGSGVANLNTVLTASTNTCEVVPANTIGSVFGNATNPPSMLPGATSDVADNVLLWNGGTGAWDKYFWTGTIWKRTGGVDRSNVVIYPDDGVFVVRRDTAAPLNITFMGTVPSTNEQSGVAASGATFMANRFPVDTTLGALGLHNIPGWVAGATSDAADVVYVWNGTSNVWDKYFWTGSIGSPVNIWKRTGNTDRSNTVISAGTAVFITHTGSSFDLAHTLPYTP